MARQREMWAQIEMCTHIECWMLQISTCPNVPMFKCSNVWMFKCSNGLYSLYRLRNVTAYICVHIFKCDRNVNMWTCEHVNICEHVQNVIYHISYIICQMPEPDARCQTERNVTAYICVHIFKKGFFPVIRSHSGGGNLTTGHPNGPLWDPCGRIYPLWETPTFSI